MMQSRSILLCHGMLALVLCVGCQRPQPVKYGFASLQVDMTSDALMQTGDWQPGTEWDFVREGDFMGIPGTYGANVHESKVTQISFTSRPVDPANADLADAEADVQANAKRVLEDLRGRYGPSTYDAVTSANPSTERIEWRNTDYGLILTIREQDFDIVSRNTLTGSVRLQDQQD